MANPMMDRYNNQTGGGGRRFDAKAVVKGYDLTAGTMSVRLSDCSAPVMEGYPQEIDVTVSNYSPKPSRPDADFEGNAIDSRMQENIPVGDSVILEGVTLKTDQKSAAPVRWIKSAPGANPAKVQEGVFTASGIAETDTGGERRFKVTHIQRWSLRGLSADEFFTDVVSQSFNESIADHQKRQADANADIPVKASNGAALRAIKNGEVVDYIPPISYNRNEKRPISFEEVKEGYELYKAHAESVYGDDVRVEILPVKDFPVAPSSRDDMARSPAGSMVRTSAPLNESDNAPGVGNQTLCVSGVIALSPGKLNPRDGTRKGAENQWVTDAYFSARKSHIHDVIPDASGEKVEVSSVIREKMSYPPRAGAEQSEEATMAAEASPEPAPAAEDAAQMSTAAPDPMGDDDDSMLDDAFEAAEKKAASGPSMG